MVSHGFYNLIEGDLFWGEEGGESVCGGQWPFGPLYFQHQWQKLEEEEFKVRPQGSSAACAFISRQSACKETSSFKSSRQSVKFSVAKGHGGGDDEGVFWRTGISISPLTLSLIPLNRRVQGR